RSVPGAGEITLPALCSLYVAGFRLPDSIRRRRVLSMEPQVACRDAQFCSQKLSDTLHLLQVRLRRSRLESPNLGQHSFFIPSERQQPAHNSLPASVRVILALFHFFFRDAKNIPLRGLVELAVDFHSLEGPSRHVCVAPNRLGNLRPASRGGRRRSVSNEHHRDLPERRAVPANNGPGAIWRASI